MLVDSHCHLSDEQFDADRAQVLDRAREAGVEKILTVASDLDDARKIAGLLAGSRDGPGPRLWGTAGVHPHDAEKAEEGDLDGIRDLLTSTHGMVAVGETGLDFFYDHSPRALQESLFRSHLELAQELDLPVVVHSREANRLTQDIIREWTDRVQGVLHCFSGDQDLLDEALRAGWMVSFTGMVTFKKYDGAHLVREVPRDRLMVETDAPYLAPTPHRGHRNEPAWVSRVAEGLAHVRDEEPEDLRTYTSANATRFFDLTP
jgi:TatD DNase family protein